jgi:3-deoxy-manno-octulosonate cytidylyltransferase (CMP-KDO synthetase)
MRDFVVVIPARYESERLPGKPLRPIAGRPMLQHVHERAAASSAGEVVIATDDERIAAAARRFGADVCMTEATHGSGTERIAEVARRRAWPDDRIVVNLQGDEPLMPPAAIDRCAELMQAGDADIATLASPFCTREEFLDPNHVKVIVDDAGFAIYFSRAAIPYSRSARTGELAMKTALYHHGIYAYRAGVLQNFVSAGRSALEESEQLEQLRALSMGLKVRVGIPARRPGPGVDTAADLAKVEALLADADFSRD